MYQLRAMQERDIPAVLAIQEESYAAAVLEDEAVIRSRLAACPELAWVAEDAEGVCAYLFAYQSRLGRITPLDGEFEPHAEARRAGGRGIGPALVRRNLQQAHAARLRYSALVSVQDSAEFWSRQGYRAHDGLEPQQADNLASYPIPALYMVRNLHP